MAQEIIFPKSVNKKAVKQIGLIKDREGNNITVYAGKIFIPKAILTSKI